MKHLIVIAMIFALAATAFADYHYASHEGSNQPPYNTWETAASLIQDAVDAAVPHDTVYVGSGDYYERVTTSDTLALIGSGIDSTRVWWDGDVEYVIGIEKEGYLSKMFVEHSDPYINVIWGGYRGRFIVEHCHIEGGGIFVSSAGGYVRDCIFNGSKTLVGTDFDTEYLEVSNCVFYTTDQGSILSNADTSIVTNNIIINYSPYRPIILDLQYHRSSVSNNLIVIKKAGSAIQINEPLPLGGLPLLLNNAIDTLYYWQFEAWYGVDVLGYDTEITFINNTVTGGEIAGIHFYGNNSTLHVGYNNLWENAQDFLCDPGNTIDSSGGLLHVDPMFDGDNDYRLQAFSPLIDAGSPDILDVDGSRSDIGCYGGPGGESYTYLDLAPCIPYELSADIDTEDSIITLNWRYNTESDFNRYLVYRDTVSGFEPSIFNLIAEPDTSYYIDYDWPNGCNYYYKIAAVDNQDNISDYSDELEVVFVLIWGQPGVETPEFTGITSNYPNPFNSSTTIVYRVANIGPIPAEITIEIYDILGRKVRTLLNERKEIGEHKITWDGRDDHGSDVSGGVYFARISQWGQRQLSSMRKLVVIK